MKIYLDNFCYNRPFDELNREPFDYTQWRKPLFDDMSLEELAQKANEYTETH